MSGSDARNLIAPLNGLRGELAARGKTVKNHALENRRALKQMQQRNNEKLAEERERKARGLSKMKQFQGVESRIFRQEEEVFESDEERGAAGERGREKAAAPSSAAAGHVGPRVRCSKASSRTRGRRSPRKCR